MQTLVIDTNGIVGSHGTLAPMKLAFSTKTVHPRDRLAYWRDEASKVVVSHEFSTSVGRNFYGEISVASVGGIRLAAIASDECLVAHTHRCIKSALDDDVLLCRQTTGSLKVHQDGRDVATRPGDLIILDPRRPFSFEVTPDTRALAFKIPRWELQTRLGELADYTAMPVQRPRPVAALASGFLSALAATTDGLDALMGAKVAQQAIDLVALALTESGNCIAKLSSMRTTTLLRLKAAIEARIFDPDLKPASAAAATGISVRHANALLANEETSLERFIMHRRLHHCRQALEDPAQRTRTVGDIAYSCGFSNLSHFARRFKVEFGRPPSECRPGTK
jgi:AraC family transcriptional activator of tynA and feaB